MTVVGVAEVKKAFSAVISEVSLKGEHFIIEKKGKPMAALVSVQELQRIEDSKGNLKHFSRVPDLGVENWIG